MPLTQIDPALLAPIAQYTGFKNRIINGAMMIDQRNAGASQTVSSGSIVYTLDRWLVYTGGSSVTTQRTGSAGSYALQITGNTGNAGIQVLQRIEANNIADTAGQSVTVSFTVSSSTLTTVGLFYNTPTATDNFSSLNTTGTISGSIPVTSTPTRQSVTFTMPSTATNGFQVFVQTGAFTSGTLVITGIQLEKGSTTTSFDYRPYGTELALCQRYYQKYASNTTRHLYVGKQRNKRTVVSVCSFPCVYAYNTDNFKQLDYVNNHWLYPKLKRPWNELGACCNSW